MTPRLRMTFSSPVRQEDVIVSSTRRYARVCQSRMTHALRVPPGLPSLSTSMTHRSGRRLQSVPFVSGLRRRYSRRVPFPAQGISIVIPRRKRRSAKLPDDHQHWFLIHVGRTRIGIYDIPLLLGGWNRLPVRDPLLVRELSAMRNRCTFRILMLDRHHEE